MIFRRSENCRDTGKRRVTLTQSSIRRRADLHVPRQTAYRGAIRSNSGDFHGRTLHDHRLHRGNGHFEHRGDGADRLAARGGRNSRLPASPFNIGSLMILDIFLILLGLVVLLVGGDLLVRGAVGVATALRIAPLLVSLTIIAFGTSAPELVVSVTSVLEREPGIALGNIIGSNIANVFLVLGLPALIYPMSSHVPGLRRHGVAMLVATAAFATVAYGFGALNRTTGGALFAGIVLYVLLLAIMARRTQDRDPVIDEVAEYSEGAATNMGAAALYLIAGLIGLPVGAHLLVDSGSSIASALGVRAELIGLTIVAFGTSLPELATVIAAAFHKKSDVAIGNVVGSNIFNIFAVGGAAGLAGTAPFSEASLRLDIPVMIAAAVALAFFIFSRRDIGRVAGLICVLAYAAFIAVLASQAI